VSDSDVAAEVIPARELAARVKELAASISDDYRGGNPVFVTVMSGALWFAADLVRDIEIDVEIDFLMLNRFGEGGRIRIATDTSVPLSGRDVILVEDIVDTGLSLAVLRRMIQEREPRSLRTVTLIDKVPRRLTDVELEYRGFQVGDEYLVGYGIDHLGLYRNLPSIWAVLDFEAFSRDPAALGRLASSGS
jgi:hypoxanthine phosphoribosyltransferase